jgi:hypothetical protein
LGLTSSDSALQLTNINVLGSHDGVSYEPIVELNNQTINTPFTEQIYNFTNDQNWQYYKLLLNSSSTT